MQNGCQHTNYQIKDVYFPGDWETGEPGEWEEIAICSECGAEDMNTAHPFQTLDLDAITTDLIPV